MNPVRALVSTVIAILAPQRVFANVYPAGTSERLALGCQHIGAEPLELGLCTSNEDIDTGLVMRMDSPVCTMQPHSVTLDPCAKHFVAKIELVVAEHD